MSKLKAAVIGVGGIKATLAPKLTEEEVAKLKLSADAMKDVISQVNCK